MPNHHKITSAELERLVTEIFTRCGMTSADASLLSDSLVASDEFLEVICCK